MSSDGCRAASGERRSATTAATLALLAFLASAVLALAGGCGSPGAAPDGSGSVGSSPTGSPTAPASSSPTVGTAGPSTGPTAQAAPVPLPPTPAGRQLEWVLRHMNEGNEPTVRQIRQHFSTQFLDQVSPALLIDGVSQIAAQGPLIVAQILQSAPLSLAVRLDTPGGTRLRVSIAVQSTPRNRIDGLLFQPFEAPPKPTSWAAVDRELRGLAQSAALLAAELPAEASDEGPQLGATVHAVEPDRVLAIGSTFKLYVLGTLADAIEKGNAAWTEKLAIRDDWKSLPSGVMQDAPAGSQHTLRRYATLMISISDNTATDHLMHRLGRRAVDAALPRLGMADPARTSPLLTTREMFALKFTATDALRRAYIAADGPAGRSALLPQIDRMAPTTGHAADWDAPRDIETIEWFASPSDLCRAIDDLWVMGARPGLAPLRKVLSKNPGVTLDRDVWTTAGFKGGSEPGVLCLTWILIRRDGRRFLLSVVLNDTRHTIDEQKAVAVAEGAIDLLASQH